MAGPLSELDWDDLNAVRSASARLLETLATDRDTLTDLVHRVPGNAHLAGLCEHYDILDKIVLHDDPTGWRLRLHIFLPGYFDRPHNHRWTYTSRVLNGAYTYVLYGTEDQIPALSDGIQPGPSPNLNLSLLSARMVRKEVAGSTYTLHHSVIHSVVAEPLTTTLIVRGPAVKQRFLVTDRLSGRTWWQEGAATEDVARAAAKRMTDDQIRFRIDQLTHDHVIEDRSVPKKRTEHD